MRIALVNPISETPTSKRSAPLVQSNRQSIGVQLGRALAAHGHDVTVYMAAPYAPSRRDEGVDCDYYPVRLSAVVPPTIAPIPNGLVERVASGRYDVVVASELFQPSTFAACDGAKKSGALFGVWQELGDYQRIGYTIPARLYYATAVRWVIHRTDFFLPRAARATEFLHRLGVAEGRIGPELPNAADEDIFFVRDVPRVAGRIVCPGSLVDQKNPMLVLDAFLDVVLPAFPSATLVFKGRGPLESRLRERCASRGANQVVVDPSRSEHEEMADLYRSASVGVVASRGKGVSLSPIEMALCGTRVVMSEGLYHAAELAKRGASVAVPIAAQDVGSALLRELEGALGLTDREALSHAVADKYGLHTSTRRVSDYINALQSALGPAGPR